MKSNLAGLSWIEANGPYVHSEDLGPEGQMIEPDPKERELPDVALEKLHALEQTEEGVYETDIAALLPDNGSNLSNALDEGQWKIKRIKSLLLQKPHLRSLRNRQPLPKKPRKNLQACSTMTSPC